jgi:hypothetical protein
MAPPGLALRTEIPPGQLVAAEVYVVVVAITQNMWAAPLLQSESDPHPEALQKPDEQMVAGGLHSRSFAQDVWQTPAVHCDLGLPVDWTQLASFVHPAALQR